MIETFLTRSGVQFTVIRSGTEDRTELGLKNCETDTNRTYIGFRAGTDIKTGDKLINPSGDAFHVVDTETAYFMGKPHQLKAFCLTEQEFNQAKPQPETVFNIGTAYGSIIGTQNQAVLNYNETLSELKKTVSEDASNDKEELEKIVTLLEMVVNNQVPPSKGLFSRFSAVMERHSWLSNSVAATILSWLMSNIP